MKKYIKPTIEVIDVKAPTLAATSSNIYDTNIIDGKSDFSLNSKRAWGSCWDDEDIDE